MRQQSQSGKVNLRSLLRAITVSAVLLGVAGCAAPAGPKARLEAYTWWKQLSEKNAFDALLKFYNGSHTDATAFNQESGTDADAVRGTLSARLLAGAPPSTFQANLGADLLRWAVVDKQDGTRSDSRVADLGPLFEQHQLAKVLPARILEALRGPNGAPYGIPLNVHRLNLIYYNAASLANRDPEHSFLNRDVLCPPNLQSLAADAHLDVKIAVGTTDNFALVLFALESVLPAVAGPEVYERLFHGQADGDWPVVRRALHCVQYLSRSFVRDPGLNWAEALSQVQNGAADFSVMGDWSNGELKADLALGTVGVAPFPGSEKTFVFTSDTFSLPIAAPYYDQSEALLDSFISRDAQSRFSEFKGSFPARIDAEVRGELAQKSRDDFENDEVIKVLATSGLFPQYFPADLNARLAAMTNQGAADREIEDVIALLRDSQPLFVRWQNRLKEQ